MLTNKENRYIAATVNRDNFNVNELTIYLNCHKVVDKDVFEKATFKIKPDDPSRVANFNELPFTPIPVKTFLRRLPFYFYVAEETMDIPLTASGFITAAVLNLMRDGGGTDVESAAETVYEAIEDVLNNYDISVEQLFDYFDLTKGCVHPVNFMDWYEYLSLCKGNSEANYFPEAFFYTYNMARENAGMEPIVFDLKGYMRSNNTITMTGVFPVDPEGNPVMRWIGIILKNPGKITCGPRYRGKEAITMEIGLTPKTELYARNMFKTPDQKKNLWYRLYAGPLTMEFDPDVLKKYRTEMKMTQREVAEAVGTTLRTYQNWEAGVTIPGSLYLLRLMNWLDIPDPLTTAKWNDDWDTEM